MESRLHDEYDRGYFEAWADYMRILPRIEATALTVNNRSAARQAEEAQPQEETVEATAIAEKTVSKNETKPAQDEAEERKSEDKQSLLLDYAK